MPVIVVGADTPIGGRIIDALAVPDREVRAFVSDEDTGLRLRARGIKVAIGDLSDDTHLEVAATECHTAVLIADAAQDGRELSFAATPEAVLRGWALAVSAVHRVIWVCAGTTPEVTVESAVVSPADPDLVAKVCALDDAAQI